MPRNAFPVSIDTVVDLLHLEKDPHSNPGAASYYVKCPFCGKGNKYHMNISRAKDTYRCVKCSGDARNLGVLDLYGRVRFGTPVTSSNSKKLFAELMNEVNGGSRPVSAASRTDDRPEWSEIKPASAGQLNKVYSAMLKLPYLKLTAAHLENLRKRGLDDDVIAENGYASVTAAWIAEHPDYKKAESLYVEKDIYGEKKKLRISRDSKKLLLAGMLIANDLKKQSLDLKGVPGFFKLKGVWFMRVTEGIAIPTRNSLGQIVGIQVRTDKAMKDGLRYLTLSSKDLPEGPNVKISRIHFPLRNPKLTEDTKVILTEGPLKADTASLLYEKVYHKPAYFIALQGVSNTKDLPGYIDLFKVNGIHTVYNGLDMDKLTNPNVAKACKSIASAMKLYDMSFRQMYWDLEYAVTVEEQMKKICEIHNVEYLETQGRIQLRILENTMNLFEKGIEYKDEVSKVTGEETDNWNPRTKGIDDMLLYHLQQHQNQ